ncbi:MAG: hypothetical protein OMM_09781, partial [Candidatus Magnetoglobus multicellularis str. Araruama]
MMLMTNITALSKLLNISKQRVWAMPDQKQANFIISGHNLKYLNCKYFVDAGTIPLGGIITTSISLTNISNEPFRIYIDCHDNSLRYTVINQSRHAPYINNNESIQISIIINCSLDGKARIQKNLTIQIFQSSIQIPLVIQGQVASRTFPFGKYTFNKSTNPQRHHFGNLNLLDFTPPETYRLNVVNTGNETLKLSMKNCPKWMIIESKEQLIEKQSVLKTKTLISHITPGQMNQIKFKPLKSNHFIGEHKVKIHCETNDFQEKYQSFHLLFSVKVFSIDPFITNKKQSNLLIDVNQSQIVQLSFYNWGMSASDIKLSYQNTFQKFNISACNKHNPAVKKVDLKVTTKGLNIGLNTVSILVDILNGQQQPFYINLQVTLKGILLTPDKIDFGIIDTN